MSLFYRPKTPLCLTMPYKDATLYIGRQIGVKRGINRKGPCRALFYRAVTAHQMEKLEPQPQVVVALGLVTVKREPSRPSV
jgi:hypothetical protein